MRRPALLQQKTVPTPASGSAWCAAAPTAGHEAPAIAAQLASAARGHSFAGLGVSAVSQSTIRPGMIIQRVEAEDDETLLQTKPVIQRAGSAGTIDAGTPQNRTGIPDGLKNGAEALSGISVDDVRVHYNSSMPATIGALAYAQGAHIHVAPGQERHLPHEVWHVVQQKQGRVQSTALAQGLPVNSDVALEHEADAMGAKAAHIEPQSAQGQGLSDGSRATAPVQLRTASSVIQMTAAQDLQAAQQNQAYMVAEATAMNVSGTNVRNVINGAAHNAIRDNAAAGLRYFWERFIDGFDGKKAELYEAELLANQGHVPILSADDNTDPDVRTETGGAVRATEIKAINSANTGNVNTLIRDADTQLGKRIADERLIKIRIESRHNLWPDARYNNINNITSNGDLRDWLTQPGIVPHLQWTDEIQVEGINVPYDNHNPLRNFWAQIKTNGDVKKTGSLVW